MKLDNYYLGLDIGTDSVGYAVTSTDSSYSIPRYKGSRMWGVTLFDEAGLQAERRRFRSSRRRIDRKQQRIKLIQELFAPEIAKVDPNFFRRICESALLRGDSNESFCVFNDNGFTDKEYHKKYPTIHHLIYDLISNSQPHDIRLVYLACSWLVGHRGHFFSEISEDNITTFLDFTTVYDRLMAFFKDATIDGEYVEPWKIADPTKLGDILKEKDSITNKRLKVENLLFSGKKPPKLISESFPFSVDSIVRLLCGGEVRLKELFGKEEYEGIPSFNLAKSDDDYQNIVREIGEDGELLLKLKAIYDWSILSDLLGSDKYISKRKIDVYNQHKADLKYLKFFVRKYIPNEYNDVFKRRDCDTNYCAYIGNNSLKTIDKAVFSEYLRKLVSDIQVDDEDVEMFEDMKQRLNKDVLAFLPKQVEGDNRVIPYQLYYIELKEILKNASSYLPFLNDVDDEGFIVKEKILSVMKFRVPYFVGPLNSADFGWVKRKAEGIIYPWNFDKIIDLDESEKAFIARMTNSCSYLPGENVLPKRSFLYEKFEVLNEINNLKVNGLKISVEAKQKIYESLFLIKRKVSVKQVRVLLRLYYSENDLQTLSGLDEDIKSSLPSHLAFKRMLTSKTLSENEIEDIILRGTYCEDKKRFTQFLEKDYAHLSKEDRRYIAAQPFKDFGRLSRKLLSELEGVELETGEIGTIMHFLWDRNVNLSELLLSDKYSFKEIIEDYNKEYYSAHPQSLSDRLDSMFISNAVKRPIIRTLDIIDDVVTAMGKAPEKIFVEMARDEKSGKKGKRTKSRKDQLLDLFNQMKNDLDVKEMISQLNAMGDESDYKLQSDSLFLYYLQLGKSMYSGKPIDLDNINYNVDHIYPRSKVADDSILNNKVLVLSTENGDKEDHYPIDSSIREKMSSYWEYLRKNKLITEEKYQRLIRSTPFSEEEKWDFINRQLVETRQSTKAVATLLKEMFPDTEIVYVKAGLVSAFRQDNKMLKCRSVNDLHHAKDAYLNVVCGNVFHEHFTRRWFLDNKDDYSINQKVLFGGLVFSGDKLVWNGNLSKNSVINTLSSNQINMTAYSFCRHGGFFDQNPVGAAEGLIPRKAGLSAEKYGGYNKPAISFFVLVNYCFQGKKELMLVPIELLYAKQFLRDVRFAKTYIEKRIKQITKRKADDIVMPFGLRPIKINTVFSFDGFLCTLSGVSNGGKNVIMAPFMPLILANDEEQYLKRIESFAKKDSEKKNSYIIHEEYDGINRKDNILIYKRMMSKQKNSLFSKRPNSVAKVVESGYGRFETLSVENQAHVLLNILETFGRKSSGSDLTLIGGVSRGGSTMISSNISNWGKIYSKVEIIDYSAAGLWMKKSTNLLGMI